MSPTPPLGTPPSSSQDLHGTSTEAVRSPWSKRWLLIAIGVASLATAYGIGRFQGALALRGLDQRHAVERAGREASLVACETDRGLLAARRSLSLVALSLDRRNFGVAENHRRDTLRAFEQPALRGVAEVPDLTATVRALDLAVDPDPGAKRQQVIGVSEALDRVVAGRVGDGPVPPARAAKTP